MNGKHWKNRIVGYDNVAPDQLLANPANFRLHPKRQQDALSGSLSELGWLQDIIVNRVTGHVLDGHLRVSLSLRNGEATVPVKYVDLSESEERLALATFDPITYMAETDAAALDALLRQVNTGEESLQALLAEMADNAGLDYGKTEPVEDVEPQIDRAEELRAKWNVEAGQMWQLGDHRLICGDCTDAAVVERVMGGEKAILCHADPPYGMGKEKDGIENDNLYREKLDDFQMQWWRACRPFLLDNASAYVWGNAPDLWRLWYRGGLESSEKLELRNEIAWNKKTIPGMASDLLTQYPEASERCLFFQIGNPFLGNINASDFPPEW